MIRFGLIGTSDIAEKMAQALHQCPKTAPYAILSRNRQRAEAFAQKHRIPYPCSTLEEMLGRVDAVYIASPNSLHCEQTLFFLKHSVPVLCEKPLASNLTQVERMIRASEERGAYLAEAYKSRYMPAYAEIRRLLPALGAIRNVHFDFCKYSSRYDAHKRGEDVNTFKAEFSNGALLDLGVYCLYPALELFGEPKSVIASGVLVPGGVDGLGTAVLTYPEFLVTLNYSKVSTGERKCEIQGEKGTLYVDAISSPRTVEFHGNDGSYRAFSPYTEQNDMVYECEAFADAVENGAPTDAASFRSAFRILDQIRDLVGIRYPADGEDGSNV